MKLRMTVAVCMALGLAACGGDRPLHDFDTRTTGPDEFGVLPALPLALPATLDLPVPTPGGPNRTDRNPRAEGLALLGGMDGAGVQGDGALMAHVARHGTDPAIRATLAQEDAAFRSGVTRVGARDRYFAAYARQALDGHAEYDRFRALGVAVPSAPPGN